jgi:hypothetical protein
MSTSDFVSIFDHAASIVRIRLSTLKGVDQVLGAIRSRLNTEVTDPRVNRELFFEPWIDSQQLGVPSETAEEVSRELHQLSVLRLWTRVRCPDVGSDEDGTVIETDSDSELKVAIDAQCPQCGSHHELTPALVETVFAPNFPNMGSVDPFDSRRLALGNPIHGTSALSQDLQVNRTASVAHVEPGSVDTFMSLLSLALSKNSTLEAVPTTDAVWLGAWKGPTGILLGYMALIGPITLCAGQTIAILVSIVVVVVIGLFLRGQVQARLAPSAVQRQATRWGIYMAVALVTAGTTGMEVSFKDEHRLTIPLWNSRPLVLPVKVEYGATNPWLIGSGVFCFVVTLVFVYLYDRQKGWVT